MAKILYAASVPVHLQNFHMPYIARLAARGDQVWTLCAGGFSCPGVYKSVDMPLRKSMLSPGNFLAAARLRPLLRRERFDLVCVHTSLAAFFVRLALLLAGKGETKVVNVVHGYLFDKDTSFLRRQLLLRAERLLRGVTDRVVVMNREDERIAREERLAPEVQFIPGMGVDFRRFREGDREGLRSRLGLGEESILLLCPAEFSRRKNQRFLIRGMRSLPKGFFLALPGQGKDLPACRKLAKKLGVEDRVIFPGQIRELGDWVAAADICVSASRYEGLPFNIMEGMYASRCVVASRIKGHADLIAEGAGGFLYRWGDEEEYVDCVRTLADAPELRRTMGEKNRRKALTYALEQVEDRVLEAMTEGAKVPVTE